VYQIDSMATSLTPFFQLCLRKPFSLGYRWHHTSCREKNRLFTLFASLATMQPLLCWLLSCCAWSKREGTPSQSTHQQQDRETNKAARTLRALRKIKTASLCLTISNYRRDLPTPHPAIGEWGSGGLTNNHLWGNKSWY